MDEIVSGIERRTVLKAAAALAASSAMMPRASAATPNRPIGKPGDFDFLTGEWTIANRWRADTRTTEWIEFPGEATVRAILKGIASVEELRIPARDFSGMGLRLLDTEAKIWTDFWVNGKSGVLTPPGSTGVFQDGAGAFLSDDTEDGKPVTWRGLWDGITPTSCRWSQSVTRDGGKTWEDTWQMQWTRVG